MAKNVVVIGTQWGDEVKEKLSIGLLTMPVLLFVSKAGTMRVIP